MTTSVLSGTYASGYTMAGPVDTLSITSTGLVQGPGVYTQASSSFFLSIFNDGAVEGSTSGVHLATGGQVTNGSAADTAAYIGGGLFAIDNESGSSGEVANYGTLVSASGTASRTVYLDAGGSVTNAAAALIEGSNPVSIAGGQGTVTNTGLIDEALVSTHLAGVSLGDGGTVTNGSSKAPGAQIKGLPGVVIAGAAGTVANYGSIIATYTGFLRFGGGVPTPGAVDLLAGGEVHNGAAGDTAATISGNDAGVMIGGASGAVVNFGLIRGQGAQGVYLEAGGSVANGAKGDRSALIAGHTAGVYLAKTGTVANFATISADVSAAGIGVKMVGGGRLTNGSASDATALILGYEGVQLVGATATNFGSVLGVGHYGAVVFASSLVNGSATDHAALVQGSVGAGVAAGGVLTNYGSIVGTGGTALLLADSTATLVVEAGSVFEGKVTGAGGTLDLASGTGTVSALMAQGKIAVSGSMAATAFTGFGRLEVGAGAAFTAAGAVSVGKGQRLIALGSLTAAGVTANAGLLAVFGKGALTLKGPVSGAGSVKINGGVADFAGAFSQNVAFAGKTGILELGRAQSYAGAVSGLSKTGTSSLDLLDIKFVSKAEATYKDNGSKTGGVLTVTDGAHTARITLVGDYSAATFVAASDGHGGVRVVDPAPPRIATFIGAVAGFAAGAGLGRYEAGEPRRAPAALMGPRSMSA